MTIEKLEQYRGICSNISAIYAELTNAYYPYRSPNGKKDPIIYSSVPSDPTQQAVFNALDLQNRLELRLEEQAVALGEIETWLLTLTDPEIESIIRWHYVIGLNWKETTEKIYGYGDPYRTRKKIFRYFGKEK